MTKSQRLELQGEALRISAQLSRVAEDFEGIGKSEHLCDESVLALFEAFLQNIFDIANGADQRLDPF